MIDYSDKTALHHAAGGNRISCVEELIDCGAYLIDPDSQGKSPLSLALDKGYTDAVRSLLTEPIHGTDCHSWYLTSGRSSHHAEILARHQYMRKKRPPFLRENITIDEELCRPGWNWKQLCELRLLIFNILITSMKNVISFCCPPS